MLQYERACLLIDYNAEIVRLCGVKLFDQIFMETPEDFFTVRVRHIIIID